MESTAKILRRRRMLLITGIAAGALIVAAAVALVLIFVVFKPFDSVILRVGGQEYNAGEYYYMLYESKQQMSLPDTLTAAELQAKPAGSTTVEEIIRADIENKARTSAAICIFARDNRVTLDKADRDTLKSQKNQKIDQMGGKDAFKQFLKDNRTTEAAYDRFHEEAILFDKIREQFFAAGKKYDLTESEKTAAGTAYRESYAKVQYIVFQTVDASGNKLGSALVDNKRALAKTVHAMTATADFKQLVKEYSELAGQAADGNYDMYELKNSGGTDSQKELIDAVFATPVDGVSAVKETGDMIVIIKRLALDDKKLDSFLETKRHEKLVNEMKTIAERQALSHGDQYGDITIR